MGTPGDQRRLKYLNDSDPLQTEEVNNDNTPAQPPPIASSTITPATTSMTVITHLPHFNTSFATKSNSSSAAVIKNEFHLQPSIKIEPLEQTFIDSYFPEQKCTHTKPIKLETPSNIVSIAPSTTSTPLDVAGPSGLQTPKSTNNKSKPNVTPKKVKKTSAKKQYVCSVCQKCFQNLSKFVKHQQVHGSGSPFKCEHCKKSFSSKFKLVRHALIHSDRKPFSCTMCERTFHRKDHLKNHIKVHSPCKKIYECHKNTCKKEYTSLISYKKHLAFHAAEDGGLDCLICEKTFQTREEIFYHLKVHAGSRTVKNPEEKKYSCDHCQRKFFTRKDVRRHMVVHTGRRDFLCQYCPQRFGRKDHLVRHIKKSHSQSAGTDVGVKAEEPNETAATTSMTIKLEADESSLSQPEEFGEGLDLDSLLQPLGYLPQSHTQGELADLGCEVLDVIPSPIAGSSLDTSMDGIHSSENLLDYLEDTVRETTPLPAFSQIFQQQSQPQLPQPPSPR